MGTYTNLPVEMATIIPLLHPSPGRSDDPLTDGLHHVELASRSDRGCDDFSISDKALLNSGQELDGITSTRLDVWAGGRPDQFVSGYSFGIATTFLQILLCVRGLPLYDGSSICLNEMMLTTINLEVALRRIGRGEFV